MKRTLLWSVLFCLAFGLFASPPQSAKRRVACKTQKNEQSCYWTHGRLALYNGGYPNIRLWKIRTHRILGIYSGPGYYPPDAGLNQDEEGPELPSNLNKYDYTKVSVFGDFEVCPLAPEKEGHMQPACIESAKNLVSKQD